MAKKAEDKKDKFNIVADVIDVLSTIFKTKTLKILKLTSKAYSAFSKKFDEELDHIKKKLINVSVIFTFLFIAAIFMLVGITLLLPKLLPFLNNGWNFLTVGILFLLLAMIYALKSKN